MRTTAYDLALIAKHAMNIQEFRTIVSTETYTLPSSNVYPLNDRVLHTNTMLFSLRLFFIKIIMICKTKFK